MQFPVDINFNELAQLPRLISYLENKIDGYESFLASLPYTEKKIIGITGPPGAGKSTIVDALIHEISESNKKVAVLCIDPSSAFNHGALLGDRIRMSKWYTHPDVFIRSMGSRGSLGGLNPMIIAVTELIKQFPFDYIIIETVGVGQNEIEIASLADCTVVALVPEAGDEIQSMKSGILEIADVFVVNKADRPDADSFYKNLIARVHDQHLDIPVIKTIATNGSGIEELFETIDKAELSSPERSIPLLAQRAYVLIQEKRMKDISIANLEAALKENSKVNLYRFIESLI